MLRQIENLKIWRKRILMKEKKKMKAKKMK